MKRRVFELDGSRKRYLLRDIIRVEKSQRASGTEEISLNHLQSKIINKSIQRNVIVSRNTIMGIQDAD